MGKAIYKPKGKAGEYAEWACNLYVGCSNDCSYCYCKRGVLGHVMGGPVPKLKSCFRDEVDAHRVFRNELEKNLEELRRSSLFFTVSSDPMIPETRELTMSCLMHAVSRGVRCQVLTKNADFHRDPNNRELLNDPTGILRKSIAFGFTITKHDEMEPGASTTGQRIACMERLHNFGYRTFASLEPIIDPVSTLDVFLFTKNFCDLFKVGLMSGVSKDYYDKSEVRRMAEAIAECGKPVYFKKSITDYLGWDALEPVDIFSIDR